MYVQRYIYVSHTALRLNGSYTVKVPMYIICTFRIQHSVKCNIHTGVSSINTMLVLLMVF